MRIRTTLLSILLAGPALGSGATGCTSKEYLVADAPPAPREETAVARPGHVWVHGHWVRSGSHWKWLPGHHEAERPGHVYVDGHWDHRPQGYIWIEGGWRAEGVVVRH